MCVQCAQIIGRLLGRHKHTSTSDSRTTSLWWFDDVSITGSESVCGCVFRFVAMCLSKDKWKSISHLSCSMKMQRKYDTWHIVGINGFDTGPTAGMVYLCIHVCRLRNGDLLMLIRLHLIFLYFFPHFIKWHFDWTWCLNTVHDSRTRLSRITFRCVCVCCVSWF